MLIKESDWPSPSSTCISFILFQEKNTFKVLVSKDNTGLQILLVISAKYLASLYAICMEITLTVITLAILTREVASKAS